MNALQSFRTAQQFLGLENEAQQLVTEAQCSWSTLPSPLTLIALVFWAAITQFFYLLGCHDSARHAEVFAGFAFCKLRALHCKWRHGENLLAPLFNTYAYSARSIYLQPSVNSEELQHDPDLFATVREWQRIDFYQPEGVCRGICTYFEGLYLHGRARFPNAPEAHLRSIASRLAEGATEKAALLQALCFTDALIGATRSELPRDVNLAELENGLYEIWFPRHRILFIKEAADKQFLVDPNQGVIALQGQGPDLPDRTRLARVALRNY